MMETPPELKLRWAREALEGIADEATQRVSWFGLDPNLRDSPGDEICDLLPPLDEGEHSFITDKELALSPQAQAALRRLRNTIQAYQQEVGSDPDPKITIDHPKWREIRAIAQEALKLIFNPPSVLRALPMTEEQFLNVIDCPISDKGHPDIPFWKIMIDLGRAISANAVFAVLDEISRPPRSAKVSLPAQRDVMNYWRAGFDHPLAEDVSEVAIARIGGRCISTEQCLALMDTISHHPGQYAALSIVYFACERDETGEVDRRWDNINDQWRRQFPA
ncbi:hypothetical protein [Microvirga terricola]|uniref:Uncharacterized protein n=1 Tax=Microvirga terricola TaxID=2719797 RepID=A0ABX0V8S2_9HYPH|nr:hypothetical protein [Microvirga terricola]NIX76087.1 hypothetical protein [Microvirga terricola]